ncbi:MAG: fibronectin type III domain-containing protein [Spirochaetaceae bacterium]|jgi:hypothetical protein|nr:fibronectin type III domain-containing protein [Spirochaetaceae bacterium]
MLKQRLQVLSAVFIAAGFLLAACSQPVGPGPAAWGGGGGSPPAPSESSLSIAALTSGEVTISLPPSGYDYEVYYNQDGTPPSGTTPGSAGVTVTGTTAVISGLTDYATYYIWVRAKTASAVSPYSGPLVVTPAPTNTVNIMTWLKGFHQSFQDASSMSPYMKDPLWSGTNEYGFTDDGFAINEAGNFFTMYDFSTGAIGCAGTIAGIIVEDPGVGPPTDGRIFIKITDGGAWGKTPGYYYAVAFKNLSSVFVRESGAAGTYDAGVPTLREAITEYAYADGSGYFGFYGTYYHKTVAPGDLSALEGKWYDSGSAYYIVIRGNTFLWFVDGNDTEYDGKYAPDDDNGDVVVVAGEIVDHTDSDAASGVLYVKIFYSAPLLWGYTVDNFTAIAWNGHSGNSIQFGGSSSEDSALTNIQPQDPTDTAFFDTGFMGFVKQ